MFGINFSFKKKIAQLWKAKSIVTGTCIENQLSVNFILMNTFQLAPFTMHNFHHE